jgi:hypothetical protein
MEQIAEKINSYRRLLTSQFGPPPEINDPSPYINYKFDWGDVGTGYAYDSSEHPHITSSNITVSYDYHQQINSWNKLAVECDRLLQDEQRKNGTYIAHLLTAYTLIDLLKYHFDFQKLKPFITYNGFTFLSFQRKGAVILDISPEDRMQKYKIYRQGEVDAVFITEGNNSGLIDTLRLFVEAETL